MISRALRNGLLVIGAAMGSGCYTYLPVAQVSPSQQVRITVPARSAAVERRNEQPESYTIEGTVVEAGDTLVLATTNRREVGAFREIQEIDTLRVATRSLISVEERHFSRGKSVGLGIVVAGGTAALIAGLYGTITGSGGGEPGPPPTQGQIRIDPVFRLLTGLLGR